MKMQDIGNIQLDARQKELVELFKQIALSIKPNGFFSSLNHLFSKTKLLRGIYLHGSVGRGKTMLMKLFYKSVTVPKEIIHFQKFMQELHIKFHQMQSKSANRIVEDLAADIASRAQVICMDEFEIKDISDAMIIMRLFKHLGKYGVFIFLTTNTLPDNLYKDGMQRESFLPFIDMVKKKFQIVHLDTNKDYRYDSVVTIKNRILFPINEETRNKISKIKIDLCNEDDFIPTNIKVFGRDITFEKVHKNILLTNFEELFQRNFGYADYVNICEQFNIIVVESVRKITEDEGNIITRFINFIDNAYFYKVLLFMELECKPDQIYMKGRRLDEFARTISRLKEMNSNSYLNMN